MAPVQPAGSGKPTILHVQAYRNAECRNAASRVTMKELICTEWGKKPVCPYPVRHFRDVRKECRCRRNIMLTATRLWGAERKFWEVNGVYSTSVGYAGGYTPNPAYQEVCSGMTGHNEVVQVVYDPAIVTYEQLLKVFWEAHDPTQGMRQGNDIGTQYRSGIYTRSRAQKTAALESRDNYQRRLSSQGHGAITTEILDAPEFYYAEEYHQQYLAKNPRGYCGLGGTGVSLE
jgi:peptide-methionine (S)-S-oxide reductase